MRIRDLPHDIRLDKAITAYRIWADSHTVNVPKGQSMTRPLEPEKVQANIQVDGEIINGVFQPPEFNAYNTDVNPKQFDHFQLAVFRDPPDMNDPNVDWWFDMKLKEIFLMCNIVLQVSPDDINPATATSADGVIDLYNINMIAPSLTTALWISEPQKLYSGSINLANDGLMELDVLYVLGVYDYTLIPLNFDLGLVHGYPLHAIPVGEIKLKFGLSEMWLNPQNPTFNPVMLTSSVVLVGGGA